MLKRIILVFLLVVSIALAGCTSKPVDSNSLRIGVLPLIINLPAYVAQQEGLFEEQGIKVEILPFRSTVEHNTVLLSGEVDGIIQDIFEAAVMNKDMATSKLVGRSVMPSMFHIIASRDSGITDVAGLKNRQIAVATNTVIDYALEQLLSTQGLGKDDIVKVNVSNMPLRLEMLNQGQVPVAILSSPLSDLAVLNGGRVIVDDRKQPLAGPGLIFSQRALEGKSEAIARLIQAWQQAVELINAEPYKYHSLLNEIARIPEGVTLEVPTFPVLQLPAEAEVESVIDWMLASGLMSQRLTYEQVVETKYLK